jgi:hypothetical protein
MTATQTLPPAKPPASRPCPNCADTLTSPPCATCGWEPGLVPVALTQAADGPVTTFAAEKAGMGTIYRRLRSAAIILVLALVAPLVAVGSAQASSAPTAPSNVKLAPYGALHFYLTWTPGSGQTGFQVTNGVTTENVTSATQDYYSWAVAAPQTYMCFAVRAYNASGYSPWAGMWTCGTTPPGRQPTAPANVTATAYSTSVIKITFTNEADNETAFLFYNGVTTATYNSHSEPPAGATFSVLWGGLAPGTYMCFKVAAYNEWGRSAYVPSSWACASTMSGTAPPAPSDVNWTPCYTPIFGGLSTMGIVWEESGSWDAFRIYKSGTLIKTLTAADENQTDGLGVSGPEYFYNSVQGMNNDTLGVSAVKNGVASAVVYIRGGQKFTC